MANTINVAARSASKNESLPGSQVVEGAPTMFVPTRTKHLSSVETRGLHHAVNLAAVDTLHTHTP